MSLGSVAIVGTRAEALAFAERLAGSDAFDGITVYGREVETPAHTVFARGLARYVYGLEPFEATTFAVLLAVPDESVPETAFSVAGQGRAPEGCAAFHVSPTLPTDALAPLHAQGYALGAFQAFGGSGSGYVAVTGSPSAISVARRMADALDVEVLEVPAGRRPLVDAASTLVSGSVEPLLALSVRLMERAGITADDARPALLASVRSALTALEGGRGVDAAAHPARQGDFERAALHLRALDPEDQRLYAFLAAELLRLDAGSADEEARGALDRLFRRYLDEIPASPDPDSIIPDRDPQPTNVG